MATAFVSKVHSRAPTARGRIVISVTLGVFRDTDCYTRGAGDPASVAASFPDLSSLQLAARLALVELKVVGRIISISVMSAVPRALPQRRGVLVLA